MAITGISQDFVDRNSAATHEQVLDAFADPARVPRFEAIREFSDHPSLTGLNRAAIYQLDRKFYLADSCFLRLIELHSLVCTNMGDPYRSLTKLNFIYRDDDANESIDIDNADAARLLLFCQQQRIDLAVSDELMGCGYFVKN